jgi:peptide/nickel transport system substrate-binding protein
MAFPAEPPTLGPFTVVGSFYQLSIYEIVHDFLLVYNDQGQPVPRLAPERPSLENGTWRVLPDGSMETTWRLRDGARWHDGVEFTAQDIVFGWKVANDRQVPWITRAVAEIVDDMRVPDSRTVVMHWKSTFALADRPGETALDPVPAHLLEPLWTTDPQGFVNSPYWTREFVGLGPFKLTAWDAGSHLELRALDAHYLGRPKISTIVVRFVTDQNTLVANLLSGTVDANVTPTNLSFEHWKVLREQWADGTMFFDRSGSLQFVGPNLRVAPFGDIRVRRGMTHGIDRAAVVDAQSIPRELIADTFLVPGSEKAQRLQPYVHVYDYDPARAQSLLEEAGWRRGADGLTRNAAGQAFEFEFRSTGPPPSALLVIADLWKAIGLQPNIAIPPPALSADAAYQADVKGVDASGYSIGFGSWRGRVHSAAIPTPETRYGGLNRTYYENPEVDALIDRFSATLVEADRERAEGEIIERVTRDAVFYPLYVRAQASSVRKGITGIKPIVDSPGLRQPQTTWNVVEWDRS